MERTLSSDSLFQDNAEHGNLFATLLLWQRRISGRHQLAQLDERLLADAGISVHQRAIEVSKPFWR
ncbi:hypothetical protein D3C84_841460 [compost metagenome]